MEIVLSIKVGFMTVISAYIDLFIFWKRPRGNLFGENVRMPNFSDEVTESVVKGPVNSKLFVRNYKPFVAEYIAFH